MRVIVVVEIIGDGESAGVDRIAVHGTIAGELVFVALLMFLCRAESEIVLNEQPRDIGLGRGAGDAWNLPVGLIGDAVHAAESFSARDLGIENQERILLQPPGEKQGCCQRDVALRGVLKAECVLIGRVEFAMIVADRGRLVIEVPSLRSRFRVASRLAGVRGIRIGRRRALRVKPRSQNENDPDRERLSRAAFEHADFFEAMDFTD